MNLSIRDDKRGPAIGSVLLATVLALGLQSSALAAVGAQAAGVDGTWEMRAGSGERWRDGRVQLNLKVDRDGRSDNWNMGYGQSLDDLQGLSEAQATGSAEGVRFELVREAGTVAFEGDFRSGRGTGFFSFTPSTMFVSRMADLGYRDLPNDRLLMFAIHDLTTAYITDLRQLGYQLATKELTNFVIHGVSVDFITVMNQAGYNNIDADDLVKMRIHGVTPEYVRQVRAALRSS